MKIIIVGVGKVGYAIAEQMTGENHDIVIVDPVSYTHLDVYKRQPQRPAARPWRAPPLGG